MRDIVATIQPEQDELVRAELDDSICVQGAPGTGKTAVGLHRAAYLLYLHRERLRRSGVLIVGPNTAFLVVHLGGSAGARRGRGAAVHGGRADRPGAGPGGRLARRPRWSSTTYGWPRCCARRCGRGSRKPTEPIMVSDGSYRWRIDPEPLRRIVDEARREGLPYAVGRERVRARVVGPAAAPVGVPHRQLAGRGLAAQDGQGRAGHRLPRRTPGRPSPPEAAGRRSADRSVGRPSGMLTDEEQAAIRWAKPPKTAKSAKFTAGRPGAASTRRPGCWTGRRSFGHVVVDEAQDLSPDAGPGDRPAQRARLDHRCSATWRRAPRRGPPPTGGTPCATSASRTRPWCR